MTHKTPFRWYCKIAVLTCLSASFLTSCEPFTLPADRVLNCDFFDDCCNGRAKVCKSPTVEALAQDLDKLDRHIERYGSVIAQHPDVWGQARLTRYREEFEQQMRLEMQNFTNTLQGSVSFSDQAYLADAFALSAAAGGGGAGASALGTGTKGASTSGADSGSASSMVASAAKGKGVAVNINNTSPAPASSTSSSSSKSSEPQPLALPDQSDTFSAFTNMSRTGVQMPTMLQFAAAPSGITVEPTVYLDEKARYLNHLQELRRINEGDDTADSPGYSLNLLRIPVSVLPGKCTDVGHGAEITMTITPHLSDELLPTTFRNLVVNDLVEQIAYPVTQFINNPDNWVYLDEDKLSGDLYSQVAELFQFSDDHVGTILYTIETLVVNLTPETVEHRKIVEQYRRDLNELEKLRFSLALQPLFSRPEWNWVDILLNREKLNSEFEQTLLPEPELKTAAENIRKMQSLEGLPPNFAERIKPYRQQFMERLIDKFNATRSSVYAAVLVPATKSRRATLPFPPTQMVDVYGFDFTYQLAVEAYRGLSKERFARPCPASDKLYIHMPDIQGYLQEELSAVNKLLANPCNCHLWHAYCTEELANAVRSRQTEKIRVMRRCFKDDLKAIAKEGVPYGTTATVRESTVALAWATIVESALLTQQLVQDMKESAAARGCPHLHDGWLPYFLPDPPAEARQAFNEYVRCRWPIHVFALDPAADVQNLADTFSGRREMQLAMSLAFVNGQLSAQNMMRFARRIEFDFATVDLNGTAIGFSHGDETFGWRFYPRFQPPDIESNFMVTFRDLLLGGPSRNELLRQRRLEPGTRECVAVVIMPSFVPYADLSVSSDWFCLTDPKKKLLDTQDAVRLSKSVKAIQHCGPTVLDADCYRDGELERLLNKARQLSDRLPLQSTEVLVPYENTLGGFAMFNTGVTDLAPELNGWYGSPSINPNQYTTLFLVGNHFSVRETRVIAGGNEITGVGNRELLSRQVMKVIVPPYPNLVGDASQQFVDIHLATPYGLSQHLLVPVCVPPCAQPCVAPCVPPCPYPATSTAAPPLAAPASTPAGSMQAQTSSAQTPAANAPTSASSQPSSGKAQTPASSPSSSSSKAQTPASSPSSSPGKAQTPASSPSSSSGNVQSSPSSSQSSDGNAQSK